MIQQQQEMNVLCWLDARGIE